jgi:hypothetical protein
MQAPVLNKLEEKLKRKPLREAFNRIKSDPTRAVKRALLDLKLCNEGAVKRCLFYWYLNAMAERKNEQIKSLQKQPNIVKGAEKLSALQNKRPRNALRSFNKKKVKDDKMKDAVRRLRLLMKNGLAGRFREWANKVGLLQQKDDIRDVADICMNTPVLGNLEKKLREKMLRAAMKALTYDIKKKLKSILIDAHLRNEGAVKRLLWYWHLHTVVAKKNN